MVLLELVIEVSLVPDCNQGEFVLEQHEKVLQHSLDKFALAVARMDLLLLEQAEFEVQAALAELQKDRVVILVHLQIHAQQKLARVKDLPEMINLAVGN